MLDNQLAYNIDQAGEANETKQNILDTIEHYSDKVTPEAIPKKPDLDETISEAKNKLKTDQLERRIEQFKHVKKPK